MNTIQKIDLKFFSNFLFMFFPISLILGNFATNLNVILLIVLGFSILNIKKVNIKHSMNYMFIIPTLFFFYVIINSTFINFLDNQILLKSIFTLKFLLLIVGSLILLQKYNLSFKNYRIFFSIISLLVSISIISQYVFSTQGIYFDDFLPELCKWEDSKRINCERFAGVFGDELIAGNFVAIFGFFSTYLYFNYSQKNKKNLIIALIFLAINFIAVVLSGERNALLSFFLILFFFVIFFKQLRIKIISFFIISIIFLGVLINFSHNVKYRIIDWPTRILLKDTETFSQSVLNSTWGAHYVTAYDIFLENKWFGSGFKSFREECKSRTKDYLDNKYNTNVTVVNGCSTHPHNFYFEVLSELGLIGVILFLSSLIMLIYISISNEKQRSLYNKNILSLGLIILFTILFPFRPTGSIFSSWTGSFLSFFIIFHINNVLSIKKL